MRALLGCRQPDNACILCDLSELVLAYATRSGFIRVEDVGVDSEVEGLRRRLVFVEDGRHLVDYLPASRGVLRHQRRIRGLGRGFRRRGGGGALSRRCRRRCHTGIYTASATVASEMMPGICSRGGEEGRRKVVKRLVGYQLGC